MIAIQGQGGGLGEKAAIELQDIESQAGGEAACIHALPEFLDHGREVFWRIAQALQEAGEGVAAQQIDIFGKHREQATHQETGNDFRRVSGFFQ